MIKNIQKQFLIVFFICLFSISLVWGAETGYIDKRTYSTWPSMPSNPATTRTYLSCYDIFTGQLLDCAITHRVIGLKEPREDIDNNGGHTHNYDTRPFIDPRDGKLQFSDEDLDPSKLGVSGQTRNTIVMVTHQMPQVAGQIVTESTVTSPPGWECASRSFTRTMYKHEYTLNVRIPDLQPLLDPAPEDHYAKLRAGTDTHPQGHYGTENTREQLKEIAEEYYDRTDGSILSINDMSLPKGGLFDINNNWATPHSEHRTGTDVDINRAPYGGEPIDCESDVKLKEAIIEVAGEQTYPSLQCESAGRKHIHFD